MGSTHVCATIDRLSQSVSSIFSALLFSPAFSFQLVTTLASI